MKHMLQKSKINALNGFPIANQQKLDKNSNFG
jgi:hypothetical protein